MAQYRQVVMSSSSGRTERRTRLKFSNASTFTAASTACPQQRQVRAHRARRQRQPPSRKRRRDCADPSFEPALMLSTNGFADPVEITCATTATESPDRGQGADV